MLAGAYPFVCLSVHLVNTRRPPKKLQNVPKTPRRKMYQKPPKNVSKKPQGLFSYTYGCFM